MLWRRWQPVDFFNYFKEVFITMVSEEDKGSDKFLFAERIQTMCYRNRRLHKNLFESRKV